MDTAFLGSMVSGGWTGKIQRLKQEEGEGRESCGPESSGKVFTRRSGG